jgi:hypothetical protein
VAPDLGAESPAAGLDQGVEERPQRRPGHCHRWVAALLPAGGAGGGPQRGDPDADRPLRRPGGPTHPSRLSAACGAARAHRGQE